MNAIESKLESLIAFDTNLRNILKEIIEKYELQIVLMNTEDQLFARGVNNLGVSIDSFAPYRGRTILLKTLKGQPVDRVTLRDTGAFHRSFQVLTSDDEFVISATDQKTEKLAFKYGEEIFGLTTENIDDLTWNIIYPELMDKLNEI